MATNKKGNKIITVSCGYGANTHKPFVQIEMDYPKDHPLQLESEDARALALNILQAAEAAEQDEFMYLFLRDLIGGGDNLMENAQIAASVINEYRIFRAEKRAGHKK